MTEKEINEILDNTLYKGQTLVLELKDNERIIKINAGFGENYDEIIGPEADACDYFFLYAYKLEDEDLLSEIGGGILVREQFIEDEFYGKPIRAVIDEVFASNISENKDFPDCDVFDLGISAYYPRITNVIEY